MMRSLDLCCFYIQFFAGSVMVAKDLGSDVMYRGQTRKRIEPGIYVFF